MNEPRIGRNLLHWLEGLEIRVPGLANVRSVIVTIEANYPLREATFGARQGLAEFPAHYLLADILALALVHVT